MKRLILDQGWSLSVHRSSDTPPEALSLPPAIPAGVPGDIASTLLDAGLIADPYFGRNELDCLWIGRTDWIYGASFHLDDPDLAIIRQGRKTPDSDAARSGSMPAALLLLPVVDTVAEVRLNGIHLGSGRNMFQPLELDASAALAAGENRIEVLIRSPEKFTAEAARTLPYPIPHTAGLPWQWNHRNLLRKTACHGGWDWGITLLTGGLYEAPVLILGAEGRIRAVTTRQRPPAAAAGDGPPGTAGMSAGAVTWQLTVICEYESRETGELKVGYGLDGRNGSRTFAVHPGVNRLEHIIAVENPELWWPSGQGGQALYTLSLSTPEERVEKRIGFRTLRVVAADDEHGRSMTFRINGRDIFAKGANWIPVDAMPARQTADVYRRLLEDAAAAHMNMIRLWGGGQYEKEIFYSLCDELGLMVWHDLMYSCALYPADPDFLAEADAEVRHQVKRLMDHPSIVLWCGNNEDLGALNWFPESRANRDRYVVDYDRLNEGILGRAVRELDPDRPWWPSSPSAGPGDYSDCWHDDTKGDMHYWSVWHEGLPFESYYDVTPRFCSEFGFQSFPSARMAAAFAPETERNPTSVVMRHHQKNNAGNTIILSTMARYFRIPTRFEEYLWLSQVQQAYAIRSAVDYWRSRRPHAMGALYWQLNDNWPVSSWSSIEYDGGWKLLHYEAARFFAPVGISLYRREGRLHAVLVNDTPAEVVGNLEVTLRAFSGEVLDRMVFDDLRCPAGAALPVLGRPLDELAGAGARSWPDGPRPHQGGAIDDVVDEAFTDRFVTAEWRPAAGTAGGGPDGRSAAVLPGQGGRAVSVPAGTPGGGPVTASLFLTRPRDCDLAAATVTVRPGGAEGSLVLETDRPAFFVTPETGLAGRFDDAGFTLLPGAPKVVSFRPAGGGQAPADLSEKVGVRHLALIR